MTQHNQAFDRLILRKVPYIHDQFQLWSQGNLNRLDDESQDLGDFEDLADEISF